MFKKSSTRGFTLIELLVVIAIIGILAAVVLASLSSARDKGADAAVKSNLNGVRSQAALVYDNVRDYATVCADGNVVKAVAAAVGNCADEVNGWAVEGPLKAGGVYCIDSTGTAGEFPAPTVVEGSDYVCN